MTVEIQLTKGFVAIVDDEDADLSQMKWSVFISDDDNVVYARRNSAYSNGKRKAILLHQLILERILGRELYKDEIPDHKDNNGLNNRRGNIRLANFSQNAMNRRLASNSSSGIKGVSWHKASKKWSAHIKINGKAIHLGLFENKFDAGEAYQKAANEYFGEFARIE